jgi:putative ABC transport system permease protein
VYKVDPEQPVDNFRTFEEVRADSIASPRLTAILLGLFASLALIVTATGIGGVIAFSVGQRTQEIGIRVALGARRTAVMWMVLKQGLILTTVGLTLGIAGAFALTRLMSGLLFGVQPTDPLTFGAVSLILILIATLACLLPARRALAIDPIVALRSE